MPNNNKSGMGTPGTQQTAQKNAAYGGVNPNMPVGQQLAKQGASSYQQSITPGAPTAGVKYAQQAFPGPSPAPPASPLSGFPYKEALGLNASLGFSNETMGTTPGYVPGSGAGASPMGNFVGFSEGQKTEGYPEQSGAFGEVDTPEGGISDVYDVPTGVGYYGPKGPEAGEDEYWQTYYETYPEEAQPDVVGIDPETMEEIEQDFIDHAEMAIQEGLSALSRQYANMGMGGSGAHMVANNALVADVYKQLQDQMNALKTMDLEQQEIDMQENIDNARNLLLDSAIVDAQAVSSFAEILGVADSPIMQSFISSLEEQGKVFGPDEFNALMNAVILLAQSGGQDTSGLDALYEQMGTDADFFDRGQLGVIKYANTQSSKQWTSGAIKDYVSQTGALPADFWGLIADAAADAGYSYQDVVSMFSWSVTDPGESTL